MRIKVSHLAVGAGAWVAGASAIAYRYISPTPTQRPPSSSSNDQTEPHSHSHPHPHPHPHREQAAETPPHQNKASALSDFRQEAHDWREQAKETAAWRQNEASAVSADLRQKTFDQGAVNYDDEIGTDELVMGLLLMRRFLLRNARGKVLETAAGSGRNIDYYPAKCAVTMIDSSSQMLAIASNKVNELDENKSKRFATFTTSNDATLDFDDGSFDTVVDTFGLCSFEDPVQGLKEMSRVLKPGGTMLLLEHGRSHYNWLNVILDNSAYGHAKRWGCWFNRDMDEIFEDAGLNITTQHRFHFGTTWYAIVHKDK